MTLINTETAALDACCKRAMDWPNATVHLRENEFRAKYQRYLSSNPLDADRKRKALTAIAAKMALVAYGIVKNGTEYQPFFEQRLPPVDRSRSHGPLRRLRPRR